MRRNFILLALMTAFMNAIPSYTFALGPNTVDSAAIIDGQVKTADIDLLAVTTGKIDNGAVTDAKITGPISASKLEKPANVIVVAISGGDFTTVSAALDSLPDPNTTPIVIKVMPGTYAENISMKSYVALQGAGRDVTTIEGNINIESGRTDIIISGFKVNGGLIDVNGWQTSDQKITITANYLTGSSAAALQIWYCSPYFVVSDNILTGNHDGIRMGACRAIIRNNIINENSGKGIQNSGDSNGFGSGAVIADNVISNNGYAGIYNSGASPTIVGNTIIDNGKVVSAAYSAGVANLNSSHPVIKDNVIEGNDQGIITESNSSVIVKDNTIRNNSYYGVFGSAQPLTLQIIGNIITGNGKSDPTYRDLVVVGALVSYNVFDSIDGFYSGNFNTKSDGTPW